MQFQSMFWWSVKIDYNWFFFMHWNILKSMYDVCRFVFFLLIFSVIVFYSLMLSRPVFVNFLPVSLIAVVFSSPALYYLVISVSRFLLCVSRIPLVHCICAALIHPNWNQNLRKVDSFLNFPFNLNLGSHIPGNIYI